MATMARRDAVLDSSIIIHHVRTSNKRNSFLARSELLFKHHLSVISVYEIELGAYRSGRTSDIDVLQNSFIILPLSKEIALGAAKLDADLIRQNSQIGIKDTFIAATCLIHNLPLLTVNVRHFERIEGLEIIDPNTLPVMGE
jgi:tRNA(fMet)-specific endonuclease VapC